MPEPREEGRPDPSDCTARAAKTMLRRLVRTVWCTAVYWMDTSYAIASHRAHNMALAHLRDICAATDLPVNADFQYGFAHDPQMVTKAPAHRRDRYRQTSD